MMRRHRLARAVEPATLAVVIVVAAAALGILVLPMRKRWNDDGADDARRQAVEREMELERESGSMGRQP